MASVIPHSFRHILLVRILLLLMPLLGISEWLVLHRARLSLLENAQQQAREIAQSRAVTLEMRQRELQMDVSQNLPQCGLSRDPSLGPASTLDTVQAQCDSSPILQRSLDSVLTQPFLATSNRAVPVLAVLGPQGKLLGHSSKEVSCKSEPHAASPAAPQCELMAQLTQLELPRSSQPSDRLSPPSPNLILNDQWLVASHSVHLAPFSAGSITNASAQTAALGQTTKTTALGQTAALGHLIVAIPTSRILAPLTSLSHWMIGATLSLAGLSIAVALYLSRELAYPAERLRDRLLMVQQQLIATESSISQTLASSASSSPTQALLHSQPETAFKIREFQQLAGAFNQLISCLSQRSTALEQATQEAHSASQLKSDFLAATSHELRTPLNAMLGHIQLIQDGYCDDAEEEAACLSQVHQAALHLLKILNELLDIARIEAGKFEFEHAPFDLGQLLAEVVEMERSHLIQKGLRLEERFPPQAPPYQQYWVQADRNKLKQVILNVISNAIKFTDQGSIGITLQPLCELESPYLSSPEPTMVLSITDTGIGIDPRQRPKLFRPFARANQSGRQPYEGTGLGLAISRTLMERMGGEIRLYSPGLGQGTTVELHLPLYSQPNHSSPAPSSPREATAP